MCCPSLSTGTPYDPLFTTLFIPLLCRPSSLNPPRVLRKCACSVWWSVSLGGILTANHLSSYGTLLGFTFQQGAISYVPARRAVSYLEWTARFSLPWHTDSDADRCALCLLCVYAGPLFSGMYACLSRQKSLTFCQISLDELQGKHFPVSHCSLTRSI